MGPTDLMFGAAAIVKIHDLELLERVLVPNSNDVRYAIDSTGKRWVLKESMLGENSLLAEALGYGVSRIFGIPSPEPALYMRGPERLWMTEYIQNVKHWSKSQAHLVDNLKDVASMLALDVVIGNSDRHSANILLQRQSGEYPLHAHSIDLETSWLSHPEDILREDLPELNIDFAAQVPIDQLANFMLDATTTFNDQSKKSALQAWVRSSCDLFGEQREDDMLRGLLARIGIARNLVSRRIEQFEALQ